MKERTIKRKMARAAKSGKKPAEPREVQTVNVTSMEQLGGIFREKIKVTVYEAERMLTFECDRLMEAQTAQLGKILMRCLPPLVERTVAGSDKKESFYDVTSPDFLVRKEEALREARALAVWLSFPPIREGVEGAPDSRKITEIVAEKMSERVIKAIATEVMTQEHEAEQAVHFLSRSGSR